MFSVRLALAFIVTAGFLALSVAAQAAPAARAANVVVTGDTGADAGSATGSEDIAIDQGDGAGQASDDKD